MKKNNVSGSNSVVRKLLSKNELSCQDRLNFKDRIKLEYVILEIDVIDKDIQK